MQTNVLRWIFLSIVASVLVISLLIHAPFTIGASFEVSDGVYHFAGGTHPAAILVGIGLSISFVVLLLSASPKTLGPVHGVFRRFVAFWIDFIIAIMIIAPLLGVLPMLLEWHRTGIFEWMFERNTPATYDSWLTWPLVIATFAWLAFYYAVPLVRRVPTPGSCVMGYQVVSDDDAPMTWRQALRRTLFGFVAAGLAYIAPFVARDRRAGKFWLDKVCGTHAETLA